MCWQFILIYGIRECQCMDTLWWFILIDKLIESRITLETSLLMFRDWINQGRMTHNICGCHHSRCWIARPNKIEEVSWASACISICFQTVNKMWPIASSTCCHDFPPMMCSPFKCWDKTYPSYHKLLIRNLLFRWEKNGKYMHNHLYTNPLMSNWVSNSILAILDKQKVHSQAAQVD